MELLDDTIERYRKIFGREPQILVTSPARVNLIGEHTDYNEGYVLPAAINRMIIIAAGPRDDNTLHLHSVDFQTSGTMPLDSLSYNTDVLWLNYVIGVASVLQKAGLKLRGMNLCIRGNIPIGSGLSSSAALETASAIVFNIIHGFSLTPAELVKAAHRAETEFVGVQCGIMDQFVLMFGKSKNAIFLDCRTLEYSYVPLPSAIKLVVCDTGIRRELAYSAYNTRRMECREAVDIFARSFPSVHALRDVTSEHIQAVKRHLSSTLMKRVKHVTSENERVLQSVSALHNNDLDLFGRFMVQSHDSLRDDYEVSCDELNTFVDIAVNTRGVFGARMTGAGFGGSGICLVAENAIDDIIERIRSEYPRREGRLMTFYIAETEDGASVINIRDGTVPVPAIMLQ